MHNASVGLENLKMRLTVNYFLIGFLLSACIGRSALADDFMLTPVSVPSVISFKQAVHQALMHNIDLKKVETNIVVVKSDAMTTTSKLLPKLALQASHNTETNSPSPIALDSANAGINLTIPLLDVKAILEMRSKHESLAMAKENYTLEQEVLINAVGGSYIEALIAHALMENTREQREQYKRHLLSMEKKTKLGLARSLDVTRFKFLVHKAESDYLLKRNEYLKQMGKLGKKIGMSDYFELSAVTIESSYIRLGTGELLAMAEKATDISVAERSITAANFALVSEQFDFFPKLKATLDGGWQIPYENYVPSSNPAWNWRLMVNAELPLFTGWSSFAAIRGKRASKTVAELDRRQKAIEKSLVVNGLVEELKTLEMVKQSAELAVDASTKEKQSVERLFDNGEATGLDLGQSNTDHFEAKNQLASARLRLELTKLRLLFAIGKIKEVL